MNNYEQKFSEVSKQLEDAIHQVRTAALQKGKEQESFVSTLQSMKSVLDSKEEGIKKIKESHQKMDSMTHEILQSFGKKVSDSDIAPFLEKTKKQHVHSLETLEGLYFKGLLELEKNIKHEVVFQLDLLN